MTLRKRHTLSSNNGSVIPSFFPSFFLRLAQFGIQAAGLEDGWAQSFLRWRGKGGRKVGNLACNPGGILFVNILVGKERLLSRNNPQTPLFRRC